MGASILFFQLVDGDFGLALALAPLQPVSLDVLSHLHIVFAVLGH
jgi:hypothetical protein